MDWNTQTKIKVRFEDVDMLGHVNNAKYFTYFEQARVAYFQKIPALDFSQLKNNRGKSVILASIQCNFLAPVFMDQELLVHIRVREIKRSSFVMEYQITEESSGTMIATGESVQVYFDYGSKKSVEISPELRQAFEKIEGRKII